MEMQQTLYAVFDKLSGQFHHFTLATSDGLAVREILRSLTCPIKDNQVVKLGRFDWSYPTGVSEVSLNDVAFVPADDFVPVDWSSYRFPNDVAEALAPLGTTPDELREIVSSKVDESVTRPQNGQITDIFKEKK